MTKKDKNGAVIANDKQKQQNNKIIQSRKSVKSYTAIIGIKQKEHIGSGLANISYNELLEKVMDKIRKREKR